MTVTLRQRNKNGKISLYLDFYHKGKRKLEYLSLYLTEKPSTPEERTLNRKTLQLAENFRAKRLLEMQNAKFGFSDSERMNSSFLAYYELMAEKRCDSDGNYGNWLGALKHLKKWKKSDVRFSDIDNIWLEDLKEYFLNEVKSKNGNKLSQNTCVSYYNKVLAVLKQALKDGIIARNPATTVTGIKEAETKREFLTLEELKNAVKKPCEIEVLKNAFIFSAMSGLRFSDIQKLTWSEIQYSEENGYYIRFRQKTCQTKGNICHWWSSKKCAWSGNYCSGFICRLRSTVFYCIPGCKPNGVIGQCICGASYCDVVRSTSKSF